MRKRRIASKNIYCFASEFIAAREMAGFSVVKVAQITGRHVRTITDWENGKNYCPQWALRLIILESRYMQALYGLDRLRSWTGNAARPGSPMSANDWHYALTTAPEKVVRAFGPSVTARKATSTESRTQPPRRGWLAMRRYGRRS